MLLIFDEKEDRLLADGWLFLFALLFVAAMGAVCFINKEKMVRKPLSIKLLILLYVLLFALQIFLVNKTYFYTGWDVGMMRYRLDSILLGGTMADLSSDVGFSIFPNNLFLFYVLYLIQKVVLLFSVENTYLFCIYFSCLSVAISCFLGSLTVRKLTENILINWLYIISSTLFILLSPWIVIPYSDTFGMIFVTLGLWAVICVNKPIVKWPLLAFSSIIGYMIKPTCLFILFAALIIYLPRFIVSIRNKWKEVCILTASILLFCGINYATPLWIQHTFSFKLDPQLRMTYTHYLMMGLNKDSHGSFDGGDYWFSTNIYGIEERQKANMEVVRERLNTYTREEKLKLFREKLLWNFNDGTFAWTYEGNFFEVLFEHDNLINDFYMEVFHGDGAYYKLFRTIAQGIWLWILLGIPLLLCNLNKFAEEKALLIIAISGLLVFLMIFEARARYLYLYSPIFLILSLCGYESFYQRILSLKKSHT